MCLGLLYVLFDMGCVQAERIVFNCCRVRLVRKTKKHTCMTISHFHWNSENFHGFTFSLSAVILFFDPVIFFTDPLKMLTFHCLLFTDRLIFIGIERENVQLSLDPLFFFTDPENNRWILASGSGRGCL